MCLQAVGPNALDCIARSIWQMNNALTAASWAAPGQASWAVHAYRPHPAAGRMGLLAAHAYGPHPATGATTDEADDVLMVL